MSDFEIFKKVSYSSRKWKKWKKIFCYKMIIKNLSHTFGLEKIWSTNFKFYVCRTCICEYNVWENGRKMSKNYNQGSEKVLKLWKTAQKERKIVQNYEKFEKIGKNVFKIMKNSQKSAKNLLKLWRIRKKVEKSF